MAAKPLTKAQEQRLRESLRQLHEERSSDFEELAEETEQPAARRTAERGEEGAAEFNEQVELELLEGEDRNLQEVADALRRMDEGSYGACEECDQPIAFERLEALPWARTCVRCQARLEEEASELEARPRNPGTPSL
jgi:RNA polymerase-binding protein DksA